MRKLTLFVLFIFNGIYGQAQSSDSIVYILPDSVEIMLERYIDVRKNNDNAIFYFYLNRYEKNYRINVGRITSNSDDEHLLKNTKRFVLVHEQKYPLILDYDMKFGLLEPDEIIGDFGCRFGGYLGGRDVIMEGYSISFNSYGKIIKEDYGIATPLKKNKRKRKCKR